MRRRGHRLAAFRQEFCPRPRQHTRLERRSLVVVTTLLDPEQYPAEEIALLYRRRWQAELHLRSIKTVLQMNHLRCRTPDMSATKFYMHLLGYNLIRGVMALAAQQAGKSPWEISFKGTLQTLSQFLAVLLANVTPESWCAALSAQWQRISLASGPIVSNRGE